MAELNLDHGYLTCRQVDNIAIIRLEKGSKKILTSVSSKEGLMSTLQAIADSGEIDGMLVVYSDRYSGHAEYRQLLVDSLELGSHQNESMTTTYRSAIYQLLETVYELPLPIISAMNGEIGPDSLGLSLAFDLRISSDQAVFFNQNLQLGFPPSPLLTYFLVQSLGSPLATELTLTKTSFTPEELLDLRLINKMVPTAELETVCLQELKKLIQIPKHALLEARKLLRPNLADVHKHIKAGYEGALRATYKNKP